MSQNYPQSGTLLTRPSTLESVSAFKHAILQNLETRLAKDRYNATKYDLFLSTAYAVMEPLIQRWIDTQQCYHRENPKRVYYLSMEYLLGRTLEDSLINLGLYDACKQALAELGLELTDLVERESDAGLGNGGLGRLAACFLDSLATLGLPAHGYGLHYDYGLFHQRIVDHQQVETPDNWLALPNPWEVVRPDIVYKVRFGGVVNHRPEQDGQLGSFWEGADEVLAVACDIPVPGYGSETVNSLRLWTARATEDFNFDYFNCGDYMNACEKKIYTENITKVLYPNDNFTMGKMLRLKQEYFLTSAAVQDIVDRFKRVNFDWATFPEKAAIQLNDTHPALAIPELMRLLLDEEQLEWKTAWDITVRTFAYTNHTMLPEALEEWPVAMMEALLPRHLEIIYLINHHFLKEVACRYPGDVGRLRRMSLISEGGEKRVRMAYLSVIGSHKVNGVAELHSRLLRETILHDFYELWPDKFTNKTNGITPRRWLRKANPGLSALITGAIGDGWVKDLELLRHLEPLADDPAFQLEWQAVKQRCKLPIIQQVEREQGVLLSAQSLFDVQVKRMHEYKRQLLFALYIIAGYLRIKEQPEGVHVPRTCIIGGKAAPGYYRAKLIIHLINRIADVVQRDPATKDLLQLVFLPNYRVSLAEKLIPAANLSEQISTAGKEASGTGNMKFALNGALTIGTLDGANIEIMEEVGQENIFIFGLTAEQVREVKQGGYNPGAYIAASPLLQRVLHLLECDFFCPGEPGLFRPIFDELVHWDEYCLMADFQDYLATQDRVSATFTDPAHWARMSILNVARCGKFSSDRAIADYARDIWEVKGVDVQACKDQYCKVELAK